MSYPVKTTSVLKTKMIQKEFQRNLVTLKKQPVLQESWHPCHVATGGVQQSDSRHCNWYFQPRTTYFLYFEVGETYVTVSFLRVVLTLFTTRSRILLEKKDQCREQRWKLDKDLMLLVFLSRLPGPLFVSFPQAFPLHIWREQLFLCGENYFYSKSGKKDFSTQDLVRTRLGLGAFQLGLFWKRNILVKQIEFIS